MIALTIGASRLCPEIVDGEGETPFLSHQTPPAAKQVFLKRQSMPSCKPHTCLFFAAAPEPPQAQLSHPWLALRSRASAAAFAASLFLASST